jgi:hypothetical protein
MVGEQDLDWVVWSDGRFGEEQFSPGIAARADEFQLRLRRLIRASGSYAVLQKDKYEGKHLLCVRSRVWDQPETGYVTRATKLRSATTRHGGLEQMRERAAPTKWTSLEHRAGSRTTKEVESDGLDGRRTKSAANLWRGRRVGLDQTALNNGDSAVNGMRRTRYA